MTYKTIVIDEPPKAKKMAAAIEEKANLMAQTGWELVTFSTIHSVKVVLVFRRPEKRASQNHIQDQTAEAVEESE